MWAREPCQGTVGNVLCFCCEATGWRRMNPRCHLSQAGTDPAEDRGAGSAWLSHRRCSPSSSRLSVAKNASVQGVDATTSPRVPSSGSHRVPGRRWGARCHRGSLEMGRGPVSNLVCHRPHSPPRWPSAAEALLLLPSLAWLFLLFRRRHAPLAPTSTTGRVDPRTCAPAAVCRPSICCSLSRMTNPRPLRVRRRPSGMARPT
jgi:hypothetical protein